MKQKIETSTNTISESNKGNKFSRILKFNWIGWIFHFHTVWNFLIISFKNIFIIDLHNLFNISTWDPMIQNSQSEISHIDWNFTTNFIIIWWLLTTILQVSNKSCCNFTALLFTGSGQRQTPFPIFLFLSILANWLVYPLWCWIWWTFCAIRHHPTESLFSIHSYSSGFQATFFSWELIAWNGMALM